MTPTLLPRRGFLVRAAAGAAALAAAPLLTAANRPHVPCPVTRVRRHRGKPMFLLHGKLWYHDNDTVSFRYDATNAGNPDRATVARYRRELGVTETPQETIWQYRRGAGFVLGNGIYQSFFDLHGGYFDDPQLMAEIRRLNTLLADARNQDCSSVAEILVVSDEASCSYAAFESGFLQQTLQPAQVQLAKLGAPHDSILVDDLALRPMRHWTSVYTLNPVLPAPFLRALAWNASVHIYCDHDDTLYAGRCFLTLAAGKAGQRTVSLPRRCTVFDPFSGVPLWRSVTQFEHNFLAKEVVIWRLEEA